MKLNSLVLFRCHIRVRLLRLPQFTCTLHPPAKFFLKFRGPKLGCTLDLMAHQIRVNTVFVSKCIKTEKHGQCRKFKKMQVRLTILHFY